MPERSRYQQKIVRGYYDNRRDIAVQRLGELATELYLSSGKKRQQQWKNVTIHLKALEVPQKQIDHLVKSDKPELLVTFLGRLNNKD
jgi:hypothetical protein